MAAKSLEFKSQEDTRPVIIFSGRSPFWQNRQSFLLLGSKGLPPHSPEVNPAEHVWEHIRENGGFKNKTFETIRDVEQKLMYSCSKSS